MVKLNIKYEVISCLGAYPKNLIKIGHDLTEKVKVGDLEDVDGS